MKRQERKKTGIFYKLMIGALLVVIAFSLYKIGGILLEYRQGTKAYEQLQSLAEFQEDLEHVDFKTLLAENEDVKAWIYARGTEINYPVVQGEDNEYYLYRMVNGEWNGKGSIFIDYRCENPFEDFNTIIYGHRMKDGSMFYDLTKYEEQAFFEKHRTMRLFLPEKNYEVQVFAVVRIPSDSLLYKYDFPGKVDREEYLRQIAEKSLFDTGVAASADDRIVMLSTCTYEFEQARLVVFGKLSEA